MEKDQRIEVDIKEIELPKLDLTKYLGQIQKIDKVETFRGKFGPYLKVSTGVVDMLGTEELRASRIFSLYEKDEIIGYSPDMKLGKFIAKIKAEGIDGLKGKLVVIQKVVRDDNEYLTFEAK